jgi:hypothetical protein
MRVFSCSFSTVLFPWHACFLIEVVCVIHCVSLLFSFLHSDSVIYNGWSVKALVNLFVMLCGKRLKELY